MTTPPSNSIPSLQPGLVIASRSESDLPGQALWLGERQGTVLPLRAPRFSKEQVSSTEYGAMLGPELLVGQGEHLGSRQVLILNSSFGNSLLSQKNYSPQIADNQGLQFL